MLKIPRLQLSYCVLAAAVVILAVVAAVRPLTGVILTKVESIRGYYRSVDGPTLEEVGREHERLKAVEHQITELVEGRSGTAQWYDFLRSTLQRNGIEAARVQGSGLQGTGGYRREVFDVSCRTEYSRLGSFVGQCEGGKHVCSVEELHLVSKSLLKSDLDVEMKVGFWRQ